MRKTHLKHARERQYQARARADEENSRDVEEERDERVRDEDRGPEARELVEGRGRRLIADVHLERVRSLRAGWAVGATELDGVLLRVPSATRDEDAREREGSNHGEGGRRRAPREPLRSPVESDHQRTPGWPATVKARPDMVTTMTSLVLGTGYPP